MRSARPHRLRRTIPAVVLAALWLCGPLLALAHGLERQHSFCAEHGAFEERATAGPAASHAADTTALPGGPGGGEDHDGCAFSPFAAGTAAPLAVPAHAGPAPVLPAFALPALGAPPAPPLSVLDVAPKSSPPSVA